MNAVADRLRSPVEDEADAELEQSVLTWPDAHVPRPGAHARPATHDAHAGGARPGAHARPAAHALPGAHARPAAHVLPGAHARPTAHARPSAHVQPGAHAEPATPALLAPHVHPAARARPSAPAQTAARAQPAAPAQPAKTRPVTHVPRLRWPLVWTLVISVLVWWGMHAHLERFITPQRGAGYWLGITGGSMMLLLLVYSARKRASWLRWMGGIPAWFEIHMVLGILGPILVLFHSNFHLGATNSNVALICMLLVAGSGVIGRYIYTRLHARLDGHEQTLEQLKAVGDRLRSQATSISFLPDLLDEVDRVEKRLIDTPKGIIGRLLHLFTGAFRVALARWHVRRKIKRTVSQAMRRESMLIARHAHRIAEVTSTYADRRLEAGRRKAEYQLYARLFSLWHVLHIPLFFMLLIAGIVHVIAVNVY